MLGGFMGCGRLQDTHIEVLQQFSLILVTMISRGRFRYIFGKAGPECGDPEYKQPNDLYQDRFLISIMLSFLKAIQATKLLKHPISFLLTLLATAKSSQGCWDRSRSSRKLSFLSFYIGRRRVQRRRPYTVLHGALGLSLICLEGLSQSCSLRSRACGALPGLLYYTGSATLIYPASY